MKTVEQILLKAIKDKCLDCSCYEKEEVRLCAVEDCSLWPYRFGKLPKEEENGTGNNFS